MQKLTMNSHSIKALIGSLLLALSVQAQSHALWDPNGLVKPRSNRDDIKTGPCGVARTNTAVTLAAGSTVNLSIERTIFHRGYFRIAFSPADDQDFDSYVLADQVPENSSQRFYTVSVTLPDMECSACTLQLIQVMLDRNPPTNYYSCADIRLVAAVPNLAPTLNLAAEQNQRTITRTIDQQGRVTIQAQISDANASDTHNLEWTTSDNRLVDLDPADAQFTFDPVALPPGDFHIGATATDNGEPPLSDTKEMTLTIESGGAPKGGANGVLPLFFLISLLPLQRPRRR
jgi:hypothetical protein